MKVEQERLLFSLNPLCNLCAESQHEIMRVRAHFHFSLCKAQLPRCIAAGGARLFRVAVL